MNEYLPVSKPRKVTEVKSPEIETEVKRQLKEIDWGDVMEDIEKSEMIRKIITERVLQNFPKARNNDFILFLECIRDEFGIEITSGKNNFHIIIPRDKIFGIPSPESYTRQRRKLNEQGKYPPTDPRVVYARSKKEKAMKEYLKRKEKFEFKEIKEIQDTY